MAAELLVVAACSHHAIGQQPVAFPRIPPWVEPRTDLSSLLFNLPRKPWLFELRPLKGLAVRELVSSKTGLTL